MTDMTMHGCTHLQRRLWFLQQLQPEDTAYNIVMTARVSGVLDVDALQAAVDEVVARHGALRTRFVDVAGEPVQEVLADARVVVDVVEVVGEREALERASALVRRPFDLSAAPLLRCAVVRWGALDQLLVVAMHHIVFDGWSAGVFLQDLSRAYAGEGLGAPAAQFVELVQWERESLDRGEQDRLVQWWTQHLADVPTILDLVTDRPRPAVQEHRGGRRSLVLGENTAEALEALGRVYGSTPFMISLAAFGVVLARRTGQEQVLVGTPVAARPGAEFDRSVGCFLNTVPMRVNIQGSPTFAQLLNRVKDTCLDVFDHQQMPYERLVTELVPEHNLTRSPLCQVFINAEPDADGLSLPGCTIEWLPTEDVAAKFDLTLYVKSHPGRLLLELVYDTDLYDAEWADEMLDQIDVLLSQAGRQPHRPVLEYSLVTARGQKGQADPTRPLSPTWAGSVLERLARWVGQTPDAVALSANGRDWTYTELDAAADRLGRRLLDAGVGRGDRVGVFTTRHPSVVVAMLAVLKTGAAFVTMDSALPAARLQQCLAVSTPRALLVCDGPEALGADVTFDVPHMIRLDDSIWDCGHTAPLRIELGADDAVYAVFTSGTTGVPKCVVTTHGTLTHFFDWYQHSQHLGPDDRFAVLSGLGYEPLMRDTLMALWAGARCSFPDHDRLEFANIASWLGRAGVTVAHVTPPYVEELAAAAEDTLPRMRLVGIGGDVLRRGTAVALATLAPQATLLNYYGTTETPQAISVYSLRDRDATDGIRNFGTKVPIGAGIDGVQLLCVNPAGQLCGVGEIGEMVIRTPYLARYLGTERGGFEISPWTGEPADRIYRTGDRVRWLGDGLTEFVGRTDHQMNLRGFRIEPVEIETVLTRHPSVGQALVLVRDDRSGDPRLVAYVTVSAGQPTPGLRDLRALVAESLPKHMEPSAFVVLDAFPLTVNGKIDRPALPAPNWEQRKTSRPASSPAEKTLVGLWEAVLGVTGIGVDDDFFELGGHSLLLARLLARIREIYGVSLRLRDVFEHPTVAGFVTLLPAELDEAAAQQAPATIGPADAGHYPLAAVQRRLWFLDQLHPHDTAYLMSVTARVSGVLDVDALQAAVDEVVARHGALRTRFVDVAGEPVQEVLADARVVVDVVEVVGEREALERASALVRRPFDLSAAPLLRCAVVRWGALDQLLVVAMHHIVFDGWSAGVFLQDLSRAYAGEGLGAPAAQFVELVQWERESLDRGEQDRLVQWWKQHLADVPTILDLVTDRPRPAVQEHRGARKQITIDAAVLAQLEALGQQHGSTLFMTLLAAFGVVLSQHAAQEQMLLGTPVAARPRSDFDRSVGCFLNTVLVPVDLRGNPTFTQLLNRVKDTCLDVFDHQQVPYERLVSELVRQPDLSRNPLFQVLFSLQNTPRSQLVLPGADVELLEGTDAHVQSDLCLRMARRDDDLVGVLDFDLDLFDDASVDRLVQHLRNVLAEVAATPDLPVRSLALIGAAERAELVTEWNDTARLWPRTGTLHELITEQAARTPHSAAVRFDGDELTYTELDQRANHLAHRLCELGVGPDTVVGVHLPRSLELMVALLAVLKAGGAYLPLELEHPAQRLRGMLSGSAAPVVITASGSTGLSTGDRCVEIAVDQGTRPTGPQPQVGPDNLAYVIYTSGSTGTPKGVQVPHRGIVNRLLWMQDAYRLTAADRVLQKTPTSFDVSVWELFWPLLNGAFLVLAQPGQHRNPDYLVRLMAEEHITVCHFVPSMLSAFLDAPGVGDLHGVRLVVCSGEALPPATAQRCLRVLPHAELENLYGPTEASVDVTYYSCRRDADLTRVPIGAPMANTRVYVLDAGLGLTPVGTAGELYLGGEGLARGYLGQPGLTAQRFVADPYGPPGGRLYRTGDRVRWLPDGTLEFLGRVDHQVKLRGFRIEPGEIEAVLASHPQVGQALVMVREDRPGDRRLVAYITGAAPVQQLRDLARQSLPPYMEPSAYVQLDTFPLTTNGKIDRATLPAPERGPATPSREPESETEKALAAVWEAVLGLDRIGPNDNFFELGGDSMHAVAIVGQARSKGLHFSVEALFRRPTIADLAQECTRPEQPAVTQVQRFALLSPADLARLAEG
ncbi:amino acid adenylation domain-containing protein [Nonomuraea sp. NPDC046570]|uniref:amino acid adenylation domain-containing protein n=1 Tax=Nonomuraea sp. NPDC046570 TaxID=3155255 RepID=UPI00340F6743